MTLEVLVSSSVPEELLALGVLVEPGGVTGDGRGASAGLAVLEGLSPFRLVSSAFPPDMPGQLRAVIDSLLPGVLGPSATTGDPSATTGDPSATTGDQPSGRVGEGWISRQGFHAKEGESLVLRSGAGAPLVVLVGLGFDAAERTEPWRRAAAAFVRAAEHLEGDGLLALLAPHEAGGDVARDRASAIAEGAILASYRFDEYRSVKGAARASSLVVVPPRGDAGVQTRWDGWSEGCRRGTSVAAAVVFARDLVNSPPSDMTPRRLAERAVERLSAKHATSVEVWDEARISAERLGGLLAVARGSSEPPRLVRATYTPNEARTPEGHVPHVVLVGKGITFDSGGLSLKTAEGMMTMKTDMTGAAIVLAVVSACAELGVGAKVTAIAPLSENMPGGGAQKPGDVFTARNGSTVEVLNTDAEGRLVLADGLALAAELEPDAIVDIATLTGAQVVALGSGVGALLGNDEALLDALGAAGDRAGEPLWPLPLPREYATHIDSEIADMKNMGKHREAGTIAAAMLLSRFVGKVPWGHLDIAGPARAEETAGYRSKGATAFGARAILEFLSCFGAPGSS